MQPASGSAGRLWRQEMETSHEGNRRLEQGSGACEQPVKQDGREGDPHTGGMLSLQEHIDECLQARGYLERSGG